MIESEEDGTNEVGLAAVIVFVIFWTNDVGLCVLFQRLVRAWVETDDSRQLTVGKRHLKQTTPLGSLSFFLKSCHSWFVPLSGILGHRSPDSWESSCTPAII